MKNSLIVVFTCLLYLDSCVAGGNEERGCWPPWDKDLVTWPQKNSASTAAQNFESLHYPSYNKACRILGQDFERGSVTIMQLAELDYKPAVYEAARCQLETGNTEKVLQLFLKAAETSVLHDGSRHCFLPAKFHIGQMLLHGFGDVVQPNRQAAQRLYEDAAHEGFLWAQEALADILFENGEHQDSYIWNRRAEHNGSTIAQLHAIFLLERGLAHPLENEQIGDVLQSAEDIYRAFAGAGDKASLLYLADLQFKKRRHDSAFELYKQILADSAAPTRMHHDAIGQIVMLAHSRKHMEAKRYLFTYFVQGTGNTLLSTIRDNLCKVDPVLHAAILKTLSEEARQKKLIFLYGQLRRELKELQ